MRFHLPMALLLAIAWLFATSGIVSAETMGGHAAVAPSDSHREYSVPNLGMISHHAGMIFSGAVLRVHHFNSQHLNLDSSSSVATTEITFRVQTAIRGARAGQVVTVREWDGLWNSGERYRIGERVLLFLYPASRLGLTSPVGGRLGRFRVDSAGRVEVPGDVSGARPKPVQLKTLAAEIRRAVGE